MSTIYSAYYVIVFEAWTFVSMKLRFVLSFVDSLNYKLVAGSSQYKFGVLTKIVKYMKVGTLRRLGINGTREIAGPEVKIVFFRELHSSVNVADKFK